MLKILWRKHLEQKQQLREAQKKVEQACEAKKGLEKARAALKSSDSEVEGLCKVLGEDSDKCQEIRFKLLDAKMTVDEEIRRLSFLCP